MKKCTSCNSNNIRHYGIKNEIDLFYCNYCFSLVSDCEEPDEAFYQKKYFNSESTFGYNIAKKRKSGIDPKRRILFLTPPILDYGAGEGHFVNELIEGKLFAVGIERSDFAREVSKSNYGITLFNDLNDDSLPIELKNIKSLSLIEVIEHIKNPYNLLASLIEKMPNLNKILITTPNIYHIEVAGIIWEQVKPPEHINLISKKAINIILSEFSFKIKAKYYNTCFLKYSNEKFGSYSNKKHKYFWTLSSILRFLDPLLCYILPKKYSIGIEIYATRN